VEVERRRQPGDAATDDRRDFHSGFRADLPEIACGNLFRDVIAARDAGGEGPG
jgi:hypothetical protein